MYSLLSTRRRLLLALLILGGKSTYSNLKSFLPLGYSGPKFYGMLKRLEKEGLVRRSNKSQTFARQQKSDFCRTVRLLPAGIELLERHFGPRIRQATHYVLRTVLGVRQGQSLSENWSLIILNFPTNQAYSRSRLTGRLVELGCVCLRDGVYVSPYPILSAVAEWAEENRVLPHVFLLSILHTPYSILHTSAWDLPTLSRRYLSLLDRLNIAKGIALAHKKQRAIQRIKSDFLDLAAADPLLPRDLLPPDYPLGRVIKEITTLDKDISVSKTKIDTLSDKKSVKIAAKTGINLPKKM